MNFEQARFNMVEQQIRPWDVLDTSILDLLFHVKREDFVPVEKRQLAFVDMQLPLENGTAMLEPKVEARLLQDLQVKASDKVLEVGTGSGYLTALLAAVSQHVYSVDLDAEQSERAAANLKTAGIRNVTLSVGNGIEGVPGQAPFDVICVGGSTPVVPEALKAQLAVGGRLAVIVGDAPMMIAKVITRVGENAYQEAVSFDTNLPRLQQLDAIEPSRFSF